jgi:hypothetical protein
MHREPLAIAFAAVALVACTSKSSPTATATSGHEISCERQSLRARYAGGGYGGQTHFGLFVLWNVSDKPCRLAGRPTFVVELLNGHTDRRASVHQPNARLDAVLPPSTPTYRDGHLTPGRYLWALIAAPQFTQDGSCADARSQLRLVTPVTFTVEIATVKITVKNSDPTARLNHHLSSCEGELELGRLRISD